VTAVFYAVAVLALLTTGLAITRANPVHALLYFVVSLVFMGVIFFTLGAPFAAALEVIVYAGAIMVLFLFVIMMLALDKSNFQRERGWISRPIWLIPALLVAALGLELARLFAPGGSQAAARIISPQEVGLRLFTDYVGAVELASMMLLAGLVGAFHLGRKDP